MKKTNKLIAVFLVVAMMVVLCVSAYAAYDSETGAVTGGTKDAPANGVLTKVLQMPKGTTTPATEFTFEYTRVTSAAAQAAGVDVTTALKKDLDTAITFSAGQGGKTEGDVKSVVGVAEIIPEDKAGDYFTKPGRYQFVVTENANTNSAIDADTNQKLTYSQAQYTVTIDVAVTADGDLYVANIAVQEDKDDEGKGEGDEGASDNAGKKIDPTDQGTEDGDEDNPAYDPSDPESEEPEKEQVNKGSDYKFTNTYVKTQGTTPNGDDDNDGKGLFIQKTVANKTPAEGTAEPLTDAEKNTEFTFNITVKAPSTSTTEKYHYVVIDPTEEVEEGESFTVIKSGDITSDTSTPVTLKHNQRLVFTDLEVGAVYTVEEVSDDGYTTTITQCANGTVDSSNVSTVRTKLENQDITEGTDYAKYLNTSKKDSQTPTGILMNNLPYIILLLIAFGGLTAYIVARRRREQE